MSTRVSRCHVLRHHPSPTGSRLNQIDGCSMIDRSPAFSAFFIAFFLTLRYVCNSCNLLLYQSTSSWFRGRLAAIAARDSERADWDRKMSDFGKLQRTLVARWVFCLYFCVSLALVVPVLLQPVPLPLVRRRPGK